MESDGKKLASHVELAFTADRVTRGVLGGLSIPRTTLTIGIILTNDFKGGQGSGY